MKRSILLSLLLLSFLGCAYYNTFFNAKKQFKKAEEAYLAKPPDTDLSGSQRDLYELAIKKSSKVLVFYPQSKYVDDALFLMGKSYFRMQEFGKARRKFEELLANYPQSQYRFEAGYLLGTIHYYMEEKVKAKDALMAVIESQKKNPWADDARFILGEMAFWSADYQGALEEYDRIPKDYPKSELRTEAVFMVGECYFKLEKYPEALAAYQETKRYEFETDKRYQIELRIGECHRKLNQFEEALAIFEDLARSDRYVEHLLEIRLGISEVQYFMGDTAKAIQGYENIIRQNEKTKEAAAAYYQLGLIYMDGFGDMSRAKEYFDKSKSEAPVSDAAKLASWKRNQINRLEEYRQKVASADSLSLAEANFALAEVYLLDLNRPDSALVYYQKVVQGSPWSTVAPQSAFAAAWIVENSLADTARGRQIYQKLIADYPFTESANAARMRLGQPASVDTAAQDVVRRFNQAEELLLKENDVSGALAQYESIVADFPHSPYTPKAICAIAWTLENIKGDRDSALVVFKQLAEKYPDSECALLARKKTAPPASPTATDSSFSTAADTTSQPSSVQQPEESAEEEEEGLQDTEQDRRPIHRRPPDQDSTEVQ